MKLEWKPECEVESVEISTEVVGNCKKAIRPKADKGNRFTFLD